MSASAKALALAALLLAGCQQAAIQQNVQSSKSRFAGRDGRAEALADIAAGKDVKFYYHMSNGYVPGWLIPGVNCFFVDPKYLDDLEEVPELAYQEGEEQPPVPPETLAFVSDYNRAVFERKPELLKADCPSEGRD